jgi:hypothetical protein
VIVAHIMGIPVEESVAQVAPFAAAMLAAAGLVGREAIERVRRRLRRHGGE